MKKIILIIIIIANLIIFGKTELINSHSDNYSGMSYAYDAYGYTMYSTQDGSVLPFNWYEISSSGIGLGLTDDSYTALSLSFPFPFYDSTYQSIDVQSNGSITFHGNYFGYSNTFLPNNAYSGPWDGVYMLWTDLDPGSGEIYFQDFDSFCVIQYNNVNYFSSSIPLTFEMILQDNGDIHMLYKDISYIDGTIGMQNAAAYSSGNGYYHEYIYDNNNTDHIPTDSTVIFYQYPNYDWDAQLSNIDFNLQIKPGADIFPIMTIRNTGNNSMALHLDLSIDSAGENIFTSSDSILTDAHQTVSCTMNLWTTGPSNHIVYDVSGSIYNESDENPMNDSLSIEVMTEVLQWERCSDRITGEHCHATAYNPATETFYSFGGYHNNNTMTDAVYEYLPKSDSWITLSPLLQELYWIDASYANGNMYILGGHDDVQALDITLIYNIDGDSFRYGPMMMHDILGPSIVTYKDSLLYCLGGRTDGGSSTEYVQIYDAYRDTIRLGTPMIKSIMRGGAAITDSIIWILGGQYTDSLYYGIINTSNPLQINWHQGSALPAETWANGAGAMHRNGKWYLYIVGGYQNGVISRNVWEYDISEDIWTAMPDYPINLTRNDFAAVSSELGMIFVTGGDSTGNLDETKQTWKLQWPDYTSVDNTFFDHSKENSLLAPDLIKAGTARIFFNIDENADVSIDVYNLSGRHVVNLMKQHLTANRYSLLWNMRDSNGSQITAGQYFIRMSVNENIEIKRIIYIK